MMEAAEAKCGHVFCTKFAINAAVVSGQKCPCCRAEMVATELVRVRILGGEEPEMEYHTRRG
jgi:hypothetical protein